MMSQQWSRIEELFHEAVERDPNQRAAFLDQACNGADIRAQVEYLLACDEQANDFIETPVLSLAAQVFEAQDSEPIEGNRIGAYKILREIGRGLLNQLLLVAEL